MYCLLVLNIRTNNDSNTLKFENIRFNTSIQMILIKIDKYKNDFIVKNDEFNFIKFKQLSEILLNQLKFDNQSIEEVFKRDMEDIIKTITNSLSEDMFLTIAAKCNSLSKNNPNLTTAYYIFASCMEYIMSSAQKDKVIKLQRLIYVTKKTYRLYKVGTSNEFELKIVDEMFFGVQDKGSSNSNGSKKCGENLEFLLDSYDVYFYKTFKELVSAILNSPNCNTDILKDLMFGKIEYLNMIAEKITKDITHLAQEQCNRFSFEVGSVVIMMSDPVEFNIFLKSLFEKTTTKDSSKNGYILFFREFYCDCITVAVNTISKWIYFLSLEKLKTGKENASKLIQAIDNNPNYNKNFCTHKILHSEDKQKRNIFIAQISSIVYTCDIIILTPDENQKNSKFKGNQFYIILTSNFSF